MPTLESYYKKSLVPNGTTSAEVATAVSDETGTGALVFADSPDLAGVPTAPTAASGTNTTQIATTAFVATAAASDVKTIYETVKNVSGGPLSKGTPIHVTGSTGNEAEVIAASASIPGEYPAHFILNEDLADDATGQAVALGFINNVSVPDASIYTPGQEVWLGSAGGWVTAPPTGANVVQKLGLILKVNTSANTISGLVFGMGQKEGLPNIPQGNIWVGDASGVPAATAINAGALTWLGTPSSANLASAVTDETGTGSLVFAGSPALTGTPTAPTAAAGTNTTQIATTAFVRSNPLSNFAATTSSQLASVITDETGTGSLVFAGSPALTGTPTAPTASPGTNTTQIATTAFVENAVGSFTAMEVLYHNTATLTAAAETHYVIDTNPTDVTVTLPTAPASGTVIGFSDFEGNFATNGVTINAGGSDTIGDGVETQLTLSDNFICVELAYVNGNWSFKQIELLQAGFNPSTSAEIAAAISDETGTGSLVFANSPALTGAPTAPTASRATSTTQVATTAFVNPLPVALSGTTPTVDANTSDYFILTTSGNTTFTFSAVTSGVTYCFILELTLGGAHTVTFPTSVDWASGVAPILNSGTKNLLGFVTRDGGTTWNANALTEFA
jgi:hypothetical protein